MSKYPLACSSWDDKEIEAACNVIKSGNCTMGKITLEFEKKFAEKFGSKYAVSCNSGSSANLLMMSAMLYRKSGMKLETGDEVLVPAVSWSTTYSPIYQCGLTMKFVDVNLFTLNIDTNLIEAAIGPKTKAIVAVNLLGTPCNYVELKKICEKHNLILLEDNCESLGSIASEGQNCGTIGLMGTFSLFYSHHLCAVEMGVVLTDDLNLYETLISLRAHGWVRGPCETLCEKPEDPFLSSFHFILPGFNLRPNDIFASIGLEQLKKMDSIIEQRIKNRETFIKEMGRLYREELLGGGHDFFSYHAAPRLLFQLTRQKSSWFGFSIILEGSLSGKRDYFIKRLTELEIETRPIVAGNFAKNPVAKLMNCSTHGTLTNAEKIDKDGFFIGNSHLDLTENITYFANCMETIIKELQ